MLQLIHLCLLNYVNRKILFDIYCVGIQFWQNMGMFAAVSNDTQHALAIMLEDENFVDTYVEENNRLVFSEL